MYNSYHPLVKPPDEIWREVRGDKAIRQPKPLEVFEIKDPKLLCEFHNNVGHSIRDCFALKEELERMARDKNMWRFIQKFVANKVDREDRRRQPYNTNRGGYRKKYNSDNYRGKEQIEETNLAVVNVIRAKTPTILVISRGTSSGGDTDRKRRRYINYLPRASVFNVKKRFPGFDNTIFFDSNDYGDICYPHDDAIILILKMEYPSCKFGYRTSRILVDTGSSIDVLYREIFQKLGLTDNMLSSIRTPLVEFTGDLVHSLGVVTLRVYFGISPCQREILVDFLVVDSPSAYNAILGRGALNRLGAVVSISHLMIKFPTKSGVGREQGDQAMSRNCYVLSIKGSSYIATIEKVTDTAAGAEVAIGDIRFN